MSVPRALHAGPVAMLLAIALSSSHDSRGSGVTRLNGVVPRDGALVGGLALPEVHPGLPDQSFRFQAARGHLLFVYFGYTTCPDVCPTTLSDLKRALRELGNGARRVDVAFVTVDPQRDLPKVLEPYLAYFVRGAHPLRARTGQELAAVEHAFGAASTVERSPQGVVQVTHSATSYLVDERGRIVDTWGFGTAPKAMASDLRTLLNLGRS